MKPKLIHQQAMDFSFKAKQALTVGNYSEAYDFYRQAAELESKVADFYFDKPDLEPTRSVIVRSAAFLNLKAGLVENAQKYIFFGLLNTSNDLIKEQLNNALEVAVSLKNLTSEDASSEYNYLNILRQRSVHYIIEPSSIAFGKSASLSDIRDFSDGYLKSLKAFARSKFKTIFKGDVGIVKEIDRLINPLVTSSAYGSFKFSIANDFLSREGERNEVVEMKSNIVAKYHNEIFTNPLLDENIEMIKRDYSEDDVNEIFRPLTKIKAVNSPYKVGYYDPENFNKTYSNKILNKQRKKLLSVKKLSQEDIGELESTIIHKRSSQTGKVTKKTIYKEQLKSFEFDVPTNEISPKGESPLILHEEIVLNVHFDSETGFKISFDDFQIESINTEFERGLSDFYTLFYNKLVHLVNTDEKTEAEHKDWEIIKKMIGNPDSLKR